MIRPKRYMSIDPGRSTGVAIWDWSQTLRPLRAAFLVAAPRGGGGDYGERAAKIALKIVEDHVASEMTHVFCEFPIMFGGAMGRAVMARGDIPRLAFAVGTIAGAVEALCFKTRFVTVPVPTWKGQLSKEMVIRRIKKILGRKIPDGVEKDAWDAIGIGLWARGLL